MLSSRYPLLAALGAMVLAATVGCASYGQPGEFIALKVEPLVGKRLSDTDHGHSVPARVRVISDNGKLREQEYQWNNGCSYALLINVAADTILSWRYTNDPEPCLRMQLHRSLGS